MQKMVSILTPCYNAEKYIDRYALALLSQTYTNCQLIIMDDGSKDQSKVKILSYKEEFIKKGFLFEYHYHENVGVGATIAEGLKYVNGDYLIWPDIDDTLTPDSIEKKLKFLEENPNYGIVRTDFAKFNDDSPDEIIERGAQKYPNRWKEDLFEDYLLSNQAWFQPGCYMIRMDAFLNANPHRYIFPTRRGQNWQMLLPVLYKYKCGYIDEPLYNYYLHVGSVSDTSNETPEAAIRKYEMYEELILNTLDHISMPQENREAYKTKVRCLYLREKIDVCFRNNMRCEAKRYYCELKKYVGIDKKYRVKASITGTPIAAIYLKGKKQ